MDNIDEDPEQTELLDIRINSTDVSRRENDSSIYQTEIQITQAKLLEAVLSNDIPELHTIIMKSTLDILQYRYMKQENKTITVIACTNVLVNSTTLEELYITIKSKHGKIDFTDYIWYGWEPIHYVATTANSMKLEVLVKYMDDTNGLTVFSENALHILLSQTIQPLQVFLYNGTESTPCSLVNEEKDDIVDCARILIKSGINVNHTNFWNEAPICLAARYRFSKIIEMLLKTPSIDLDYSTEAGVPIAEYLKQNHIYLHILPPMIYCYHRNHVKILFDYLKAGDEESFLKYNNENIRDFANSLDGDSETNTCGTMLQFCFKKGFMEYLQSDRYSEKLSKHTITDTPMMSVFLKKGLKRCIMHLLKNKADPDKTDGKCKEPLLEAAAVRGYYPLVAILLEDVLNPVNIFFILPTLFRQQFTLINHIIYRNYVLHLLMNKLIECYGRSMVKLGSKYDKILNRVLYQLNLELDDNKPDESEIICQILSLGASLTYKEKPLDKMIIERLHPSILRLHFDDCIDNNHFCYNSIVEDSDFHYSETNTLQFLMHDPNKNCLLIHPLLVHFIHNKWLRIAWFFYLDLFFYTGYLLSICSFMVCKHEGIDNMFVNYTFYILLFFHLFKEILQLIFFYRWKYFRDLSHYTELTIILLCFVTLFHPNIITMVLSILFATIVFFLLLGQLPVFTKYTIILGSTKYFLQYVGFYFFQFVSFAICFNMVFPFDKGEEQEPTLTSKLFKHLFYSLVLFTGEFNERVLNPTNYPVFGRILTTIFIFFMTIILNNLLVGLIVSDINEIQSEARFKKQVKAAQFVVRTYLFIKRIRQFKSLDFIKHIIGHIHLFKKNNVKTIDRNVCTHKHVMNAEDIEYLKDLKTRREKIFDADVLWNINLFIKNNS